MLAILTCCFSFISNREWCFQKQLATPLLGIFTVFFTTTIVTPSIAADEETCPLAHTPEVLQAQGYFASNPNSWSHSLATPLAKELSTLMAESALGYYGGRLAEYASYRNYLNGYQVLLQPALVGIAMARALWSDNPAGAMQVALLPFLNVQSNLLHGILTAGTLASGVIDAVKSEYRMWQYQNAQLPMKEDLPGSLAVVIKRSEGNKDQYNPAAISLFWINMVQPPLESHHEANQSLITLIHHAQQRGYTGIRLRPIYYRGGLALSFQWLTREDGWLEAQIITIPDSQNYQWWLDLPQMHSEAPSRKGQAADPLSPSILAAIIQQRNSLNLHNDNILSQVQELDGFSLIAGAGHFSVWMVPDFLRGLLMLNGNPMPGVVLQASHSDTIPNLQDLKPYFSRPAIPTWAEQIWPLAWKTVHTLATIGAWTLGTRYQNRINEYNRPFEHFNGVIGKYPETQSLIITHVPTQEEFKKIRRGLLKWHPDKAGDDYTALFQDVNGAAEKFGHAMKEGGFWDTPTTKSNQLSAQPEATRVPLSLDYKN
ncbi:hypothetical protein [Sansalvadorimonas verongulae]|uniref:hypothetical protein n=1 Tax=Sansalvadorimonas verongulae TaxID=2172824 RepID=UPI0012BB4EEC|nr:hypothetical protein [Sansalvadorimonas verongulae]MTI13388.1 hypothetical protein [Sansalvadorimonas verongulae]